MDRSSFNTLRTAHGGFMEVRQSVAFPGVGHVSAGVALLCRTRCSLHSSSATLQCDTLLCRSTTRGHPSRSVHTSRVHRQAPGLLQRVQTPESKPA